MITSTPPSDCRQRQRIFKTLTNILKSQQSQIESLADDRYFLEKYIHVQHDHWSTKLNILDSQIDQLKRQEEKVRKVDEAKFHLFVEMKDREAFCYKKYSEFAESDLDDFLACMENAEILEMKKNVKTGASGSRTIEKFKDKIGLEEEIRNLKHSYNELNSEKEADISALLREKDFVSHQLQIMENHYTSILNSKKVEVEQANEAAAKLQSDLQKLQTLVCEKEEVITKLHTNLDSTTGKHSHEAERANEKIKQLELVSSKLNLLVKEKDGIITKLRNDLVKIEFDGSNHSDVKYRCKKRSDNGSATASHVTSLYNNYADFDWEGCPEDRRRST